MRKLMFGLLVVLSACTLSACKGALEQTEPGPGQKTVIFKMSGTAGTKVTVHCNRVTDQMHAGFAAGQEFQTTLPMEKKMFLGPSEYDFGVYPLDRPNFHVTADGQDVPLVVSGNSVMFEIK